jgi:hypothetical protein
MQALTGEETLRLIANLPAPSGLEDRLHRSLREAPRKSRVLAWPASSNWLRSAAAAAIVLVVVGGGWGVYSRVQPGQAPNPGAVPVRGGFGGAGVVRTPVTLPGPNVREQATEGTRNQETQSKKKAQGPKKNSSAAPAGQHALSQIPPQ